MNANALAAGLHAVPDATAVSGLAEILPWPRRTALVVGEPGPAVLGAFHALGFSTAVAPWEPGSGAAAAERVAGLAAPFTFLVVCDGVLQSDADVEAVRRLHEYAPMAHLLLDCPVDEREPDTLVRAVHAGVVAVADSGDPIAFEAQVVDALRRLGEGRERVLAIGAHPDDVEIGCAGTLLDQRLRGERITILTLSRGAVGGDQRRRLREAEATAAAIGAQLIVGDLPDTRVDDGIDTIRLIEEVVAAIAPTVVFTHSAHDNHQDHRAVASATISATRQVRRVYAYQSPSATNAYRPTSFVPIDHVLQRKVQVLMMFDSQNGRSYLEPELVVAGSRYWARHLSASARYAEPFEVVRSVGDLRHALSTGRPAASPLPEFGLPAYEPGASAVSATALASNVVDDPTSRRLGPRPVPSLGVPAG